jgi:hypothetical protein
LLHTKPAHDVYSTPVAVANGEAEKASSPDSAGDAKAKWLESAWLLTDFNTGIRQKAAGEAAPWRPPNQE